MDFYQFETEEFRFSLSEIHFLRSRFPYRKVLFSEVTEIGIVRAVRVKHPILVLIFGLILVLLAVIAGLHYFDFFKNTLSDFSGSSSRKATALAYYLMLIGFLGPLGGVAIYWALVPTWVLRIRLRDGVRKVFSLRKLNRGNHLLELSSFLKKQFAHSTVKIDRRIG